MYVLIVYLFILLLLGFVSPILREKREREIKSVPMLKENAEEYV
jgi:hypothetical protein